MSQDLTPVCVDAAGKHFKGYKYAHVPTLFFIYKEEIMICVKPITAVSTQKLNPNIIPPKKLWKLVSTKHNPEHIPKKIQEMIESGEIIPGEPHSFLPMDDIGYFEHIGENHYKIKWDSEYPWIEINQGIVIKEPKTQIPQKWVETIQYFQNRPIEIQKIEELLTLKTPLGEGYTLVHKTYSPPKSNIQYQQNKSVVDYYCELIASKGYKAYKHSFFEKDGTHRIHIWMKGNPEVIRKLPIFQILTR